MRAERVLLRKVLEHLNLARTLAYSVFTRIKAPCKFDRAPKALVSPRESSVNDILAIATDGDKTTIRVVLQALRIEFGVTQILCRQWKSFAVGDFEICRQRLDVCGLYFVVLAPDDLPRAIHARHGLFATDLEHHSTFIVTDRYRVRALQASDRPNPL